LIDAGADTPLWANTFERSSRDVLALQASISLIQLVSGFNW
jgi:TolB-like protein